MDVLLSVSNQYAYFKEGGARRLDRDLGHQPWFWAVPKLGEDPAAVRARILQAVQEAQAAAGPMALDELPPLAKVRSVGEVQDVASFVDFDRTRPAIPVTAKRSWFVPDISDELFTRHGVWTAEHDVPYQQRACVDLAAQDKGWVFDTGGKATRLKVLVYDIETTQFTGAKKQVPIDMIGWSEFEFTYEAAKDLDAEEFHFEITEAPPRWDEPDVEQSVARNRDEEIDHLLRFVRRVPTYHIVSGHNILGFDNKEVVARIEGILDEARRDGNLNPGHVKTFEEFLSTWSSKERNFTFGSSQEVAHFYPTSLDTLHAARKFYFFLDDFTLKGLAPFLGVKVPDRVYLSPQELDLADPKTALYNKHDIQEQLGVSTVLLGQALPLAFTVGWTLEELLTGGNTKMWDHVAAIRCARERKLLPATCRAQSVATTILRRVGPRAAKEQVAEDARRIGPEDRASGFLREYVRVAKYGDEMPNWAETPEVIVNPNAAQGGANGEEAEGDDEEETLAYAIAGGMTIHPQKVGSHFVPWWHVVAADVGAMYPTILRARNLGADTVRLARGGETPDDWVLLYRLPAGFGSDDRFVTRRPTAEDGFVGQDAGTFVGVKVRKAPGAVPRAMGGIMRIATKIKRELAALEGKPDAAKDEVQRKKNQYASIKAARNAGTHGIMVAVNVSCRQFNLWAGANITTLGQRILHDSLKIIEGRGAKVGYGDSIVGDRNVVVKDPQGLVRVMPIEELFETVEGQPHEWHGKEAVTAPGWSALSLDPQHPEGGPVWSPLKRVIRHETTKTRFRVRQATGATVCTEDHSLMGVDAQGVIRRSTPQEMLARRMVRVACPPNETLHSLDLLDWFEPRTRLNRLFKPDGRFRRRRANQRLGYDDDWIWFADPNGVRDGRPPRFRRRLEAGSEELSALCRLLGAYASEGSVHWGQTRKGASVASSDRAWLERVQSDYYTLFDGHDAGLIRSDAPGARTIQLKDGSLTTHEDPMLKVQMTNVLSAAFFWALAGKGSHGKRIPDFLFNLPRAHQLEFLETLVEGDGNRRWGPRYTEKHNHGFFDYTTPSLRLASGLSVLLSQLGMDHWLRYDPKKKAHAIATRGWKKANDDAAVTPEVHEGPVYDLEVEGTHTFVDAYGSVLLHNTDGLYIGCGKSAKNLMDVSEALGVEFDPKDENWIITPDEAVRAIEECNEMWRAKLNYPDFELEPEHHACMVFVVHKNYLIFDVKGGKLRMTTKGNNFRGSDKAPVAQKLLAEIMRQALVDTVEWSDEESAREAMKGAIKRATREVVKSFDATKVELEDLTLRQLVKPVRQYKGNPDGSPSIWQKRTKALQEVIGEAITAPRKFRFVVTKKPLPGIDKPSKTGIKPLDYMYPVDFVKDRSEIDLDWYRDMMEKYIRGAFGFEDLEMHSQRGLDAWM